MMEYKGYVGKVEYNAESETLHGEVVGIRDVVTFEGRSVEELRREFRKSVEVYLEVCKDTGKEPDRPFSGKFVARLEPELHRAIATQAALAGKSLNAWVVEVLRQAAARDPRPRQGAK
jgi:predicted HicB family RNase H-like nuclease